MSTCKHLSTPPSNPASGRKVSSGIDRRHSLTSQVSTWKMKRKLSTLQWRRRPRQHEKRKRVSLSLLWGICDADYTKPDAQSTKRKKKRGDISVPLAILAQPVHKEVFKDRFNISNDQAYEITRERHRVRQTFGQLIVQHAYPAVKLQLPWVMWYQRSLSGLT